MFSDTAPGAGNHDQSEDHGLKFVHLSYSGNPFGCWVYIWTNFILLIYGDGCLANLFHKAAVGVGLAR